MKSQITEILQKIENLQKSLKSEYGKLLKTYGYKFEKNKIVFLESIREKNLKLKQGALAYLFTAEIRHLISIPFVYSVIIPMLLLDIFLWIYQMTAFPPFKIQKVKRSEYIVYDRQYLDYLNLFQKINCLYCSYGNGLFAYAVEIAARTERYWCPIKAARSPLHPSHRHYKSFADYGDADGFNEIFNKIVPLQETITSNNPSLNDKQ